MLEHEIWKPIPGYEGRYEVSSFGRIKSIYDGRNGHVKDEKRINHIIREAKREAAEEMYDLLVQIYSVDPRSEICMKFIESIPDILKKARGES